MTKQQDFLIALTAHNVVMFLLAAQRAHKKRRVIGYAMSAGIHMERLGRYIVERSMKNG